MTATTHVRFGVVRVIGPQPRRHLRDARRAAEVVASEFRDDRRLLLVRRLAVRASDVGAAHRQLDTLRRHAVRPALGPVPADAVAVEFADEAEMLAALTADIVYGVARSRWWWASQLPLGTTSDAELLEATWLAKPHWVPVALDLMHRCAPDLALRAVQTLTPLGARHVRAAVAEVYRPAPPVAAADPGAAPSRSAPDPTPQATDYLVAQSNSLDRTEAPPPSGPAATEHRLLLAEALRLAGGDDTGLTTVIDLPAPLVVSHAVAHVVAQRPVQLFAAPSAGETMHAEPRTPLPSAVRSLRPHLTSSSETLPPSHHPWLGSGRSVATGMATMLYAVNLLPLLPAHAQPSTGRSGWAVLEALGRWRLRGLPRAVRRNLLSDPLFGLLAWLDGREPGVPTSVHLGDDVRPVRRFLDDHAVTADSFLRPGRLVLSRTHLDVLLALDQIDLAARRCGLDQDPGWQPALGRIVLFHFEDRP